MLHAAESARVCQEGRNRNANRPWQPFALRYLPEHGLLDRSLVGAIDRRPDRARRVVNSENECLDVVSLRDKTPRRQCISRTIEHNRHLPERPQYPGGLRHRVTPPRLPANGSTTSTSKGPDRSVASNAAQVCAAVTSVAAMPHRRRRVNFWESRKARMRIATCTRASQPRPHCVVLSRERATNHGWDQTPPIYHTGGTAQCSMRQHPTPYARLSGQSA